MNMVYIVMDADQGEILCVCDSEEAAKAYMNTGDPSVAEMFDCVVEAHTVTGSDD